MIQNHNDRKKTYVQFSLLNKVIILLHGLLGAFHVTNGGFACLSNPCLFGVCIDDLNSTYSCYCIDGYTGVQCQTNWDECWSSPCLNGATCIDGVAQYNCSCSEGFNGQNCEENLDECLSNPCQNGGSCNDKDNGYVCICLPGFLGLHCENDLAVCELGNGTRCNNGGQCIEGKGLEFSCDCLLGWQGEYCENEINECESSPCQNGGICLDKIAHYACACSMGFTGQNCEENVLLCQDSPCENSALCLMEEGLPVCYCVPDYHGEKCELQYDECQLGPRCVNGGTCIDGVDDFSCSCPPSLTGIFCECLVLPESELDCNYTSVIYTTTDNTDMSHTTTYRPYVYENSTEFNLHTTPYTLITTEDTETTFHTSDFSTTPFSFSTVFVPITNQTFPTTYNLVTTTTTAPNPTEYTDLTPVTTQRDLNFNTPTESIIDLTTTKDTTTTSNLGETTVYSIDSTTVKGFTTFSTVTDSTTVSGIDTTTLLIKDTTTKYDPTTTTELETDSPNEVTTQKPLVNTVTGQTTTTTLSDISTETTIAETIFFTDLPSEASIFTGTLSTPATTIFSTDIENDTRTSTQTSESTTFPTTFPTFRSDDNATLGCESFSCQNGGTCVNTSEGTKCVCRFDRHGKQCEMPLLIHNAAFAGDSYISHKLYSSEQNFNVDQSELLTIKLTMQVEVKVRTRSTEGLIILATAQGNYGNHYMALFLHRGLLQFQFSCGLQTMLLSELETPVNTGEELLIQVELDFIRDYSHCNASLKVNDTLTMSGDQPTWLHNHNMINEKPVIHNMWVHLGGAPQAPFGLSNEIVNEQGFTGCLHKLKLNDVNTNIFNDAHDGFGVTECGSLACLSNPCQNGASCIEDDYNHYKNQYNIDNEYSSSNVVIQSMHDSNEGNYDKWRCKCPTGYMGKTCEISICDNNPCQYGGSCVTFPGSGYICLCPLGKHGHYCEHNLEVAQPSFSGSIKGLSSYIAYSVPVPLEHAFELSFKIIPTTISQIALLAFLGQVGNHDEKSDHLAVSFIQGYIMLTWNLGAGPRRIFIQKPIEMRPDKEPHEIRIGRVGRKAWLNVNGKMNVTGRSPGTADQLDITPTLYLGGHDHANFTTLPHDLPLHSGFQGCIFDVKFKSGVVTVPLQSTKSIRGRSVGQCGTKECHRYACRHDGACLQYGATFTCICQEGWYGPLCLEQSNLCDTSNNQCAEGSFCVPLVNKYECDCPTGKSGKNCETKIISLSDISLSGRRSFLSVKWPDKKVKSKIIAHNASQHHENEIISKHYQISKQFQYHSVGITAPKAVSNSIFLKFVNEQEFPLDFDKLKTSSANFVSPLNIYDTGRQPNTIQSFSIELQIRPLSERGLLVFYGIIDSNKSKNNLGFVSLSLQGGVVEYRISGGNGEVITVRSSRILAIGEWHKIKISQNGKRLILLVEGSATQTSLPPGFSFLQKTELIYIGGLPDLSRLPHNAVSGFPVPFRGCIRQLHINGLRIVLNESNIYESRNIADCDGTACGGDTCDLGGHCWLDEKMKAHCKCPQYSRGDRCETLEHCNVIKCKNGGVCDLNGECRCPIGWGGFYCEIAMGQYSAPSFHGSSYLKLPPQKLSQKDKRAESSYQIRLKQLLQISFKFSTIHENGLILWSNNTNYFKNSSKFVGVGIEKGHLKFTTNIKTLNNTNIDITIGYYVADGAWHNVGVEINPENTILLLDDKIVFSEKNKNLNITNLMGFNDNISLDDTFYIGGAPNRNSIAQLTANKFYNAYFGCLQDISFGTDQHILINDFSGFEGENLGQCELYDEFI